MSANKLRFDGKVAVITGAGGGLGREYALLLAERGASVVVNDLGGSRSGEGQNSSAAERVVSEINAKGGKAVADFNSVEDGERIIQTAIDNYGRIDILINNAGILRDKSFLKLTTADWDSVVNVHLRGSFMVTKAAWPYFKQQNSGRIIMTASGAGVFGNFGQANYASAKLGLVGLSNTLAVEGAKYNIHCNAIVPLAGSRLTQDIFPQDWFDQLKPEYISPVVVWLCHDSCTDNGGIFEAAGGWVGKYRFQRSLGKAFIGTGEALTPESVRDSWSEITNMMEASAPANIQEHTGLLVEALTGAKEGKMKSKKETSTYSYNHDHAILYALGVGMSTAEADHLHFLYEGSEDFRVLPTFGTIISMPALLDSAAFTDQIDKLKVDLTKMVHGEQFTEILEPLPPAATLNSVCRVTDVLDKGSGALIITDVDTYDEHGVKVMRNQWSILFLGAGNFGGPRSTDKAIGTVAVPNRAPDASIQEKTSNNQAALYRLCGDKNPLHIDPSFAAMGGFSEPILHGLCSYGYAVRHVLQQWANNDVKKFKSMKARFSGAIQPGQTIKTDMWKEGNRIIYQCSVAETGKPVISGGFVDLEQVIPAVSGISTVHTKASVGAVKSNFIFTEMAKRLKSMPDLAVKTQAIFEYSILKDKIPAAQWIVDLKTGQGEIYKGQIKNGKPDCTLAIEDDDMFAMVTGKLDPRKAFMAGKLKVKGNIMLLQKLQSLMARAGKKPETAPVKSASVQPNDANLKSEAVFANMSSKISKSPHLVEDVGTVYQWNITKNGQIAAQWTLDLKNGKGSVYKGTPKIGKADCTFALDDEVMHGIHSGKLDPQRAFMSGKLKISGNILASQKLHSIWEEDPGKEPPKMAAMGATGSGDDPPALEEPIITCKSDIIFKLFSERLEEEPEIAQKMKVVYHWNVFRGGRKSSEWTVDLKTGIGAIYKGPPAQKADVIMTLEDEDVIKLMTNKLNPQRAFMTGKLKIKGNIMLTQKLNQLWQEILKSGRVVELPMLEPILQDKPLDPELRSEYYFLELGKKLARMPDLVDKVQAIFEWNITKNGKPATKWTLEMKKQPGALYRGESKSEKSTCVLTVDDNDFAELVIGRLPSEKAFGTRVKMGGDAQAAMKLTELFKPQQAKL